MRKLLNGFQCTEYVTCESKGSILCEVHAINKQHTCTESMKFHEWKIFTLH